MAYYDGIAKKWHRITGYKGGALKELILNDQILRKIPGIDGKAILELGAGSGYFMPLMSNRFSGQSPSRIVITDLSNDLLAIARRHFMIDGAEYQNLDVRAEYPYPPNTFHLILATMVFNEVTSGGLQRALRECHRVLSNEGQLIISVAHPAFVESLSRRGQLKKTSGGFLTMPSVDGVRLPVVRRSVQVYEKCLNRCGFEYESEDVRPSRDLLNKKPGLRKAGNVPIALLFNCSKESR